MFAAYILFTFLGVALADDSTFSQPVPFDIKKVVEKAIEIPSHSWEYGTAVEAQLELFNPELSVYGKKPFPVPTVDASKVKGLAYAAEKITIGTGQNALSDGDGAVGDPASLGVAAYMLGKSNATFANATIEQLSYVVNRAPRAPNSAISHRADVVELWADFMYMAPPFIAYYGAATGNESLLEEAFNQCTAYREVLSSKSSGNGSLWQHIVGPQSADLGHWSTGQGWATAGMARIAATIQKAPCADEVFRLHAVGSITHYIKEIVDDVLAAKPNDTLVRNYVDDYTSLHGFGELSGTSMIASVIYRMAVIAPLAFGSPKYIRWADNVLITIGGKDFNGTAHVTPEGIVRPTVNPLGWTDIVPFEKGSPEGQGMVTLAYAAYRDCVKAGKCSGKLESAELQQDSTEKKRFTATGPIEKRSPLKRQPFIVNIQS